MSVIDIGPGATNRSAYWDIAPGATTVDYGNPSNGTGTLDTFEIWANADLSNCKIGTFYGSGTSWDDRDYETIGTVTSGSKQTFTGKNCSVETDDILGVYALSGKFESATSGAAGTGYVTFNAFGGGAQQYTGKAGDAISLYATGATVAAGNPYYYYLNQ